MSSPEAIRTLDMMKTPQFKWRTQYTTLYIQRFPHLGYQRATSKGFATSDREIGRGDWEIPMEVKPEPKLTLVEADVEDYVGGRPTHYLQMRDTIGAVIGEGNDTVVSLLEYTYWHRVKWKMMTIPFVNYMLKQAGFKR